VLIGSEGLAILYNLCTLKNIDFIALMPIMTYLCLMSSDLCITYYQVMDSGCSNMDIGYTYTANSYYTSNVWRI